MAASTTDKVALGLALVVPGLAALMTGVAAALVPATATVTATVQATVRAMATLRATATVSAKREVEPTIADLPPASRHSQLPLAAHGARGTVLPTFAA